MIRLVMMSNKWYAVEINKLNAMEIREIEMFVDECNLVLLCYDLEIAEEYLGADNITLVTRQ